MSVETPHPRDVFALEGAEGPEAAFLDALGRGRLHHAWLLVGPEGVGKATFAYRAARRLLGARPDPAYGVLGASPEDPISRQVSARSHPDLLVLERETYDGKSRRNIPVDEARKLPEFFSKAPASAPYRVAIIDAADDMNNNAANAVLKTLEEPPPRGVVFLVSHAPGRLLPTVRSRCRRLAFRGWDLEACAGWVTQRSGVGAEDARRLARMARGAPGRALQLAGSGAVDADRSARDLLRALPSIDEAQLLSMAESFRGAEGQARFELLFERLADHIRLMAEETAEDAPAGSLDRWAEAWEFLVRLPGEAEAVNLDRADAFWTAIGRLREAARAPC
ncbi:MAG: DNA polymerase III subunit delta' [Acetobacteraceae bacterium]|nr:DNA polymerase III subunit delta' [Acetobacteraceae bacterium]